MNKLSKRVFGSTKPSDIFLDLLTFERLLTKPVIHLIYWAGLLLLVISAFGVVGASVGVAINEAAPWGWFLAMPMLVGGMLFVFAGMLLWRSFCEFYVAIFRIADDLNYLRNENEGLALKPAPESPSAPAQPTSSSASTLSTPRAVAQPADARPSFDSRPSFDARAVAESRASQSSTAAGEGVAAKPEAASELDDPFFRRLTRVDDDRQKARGADDK